MTAYDKFMKFFFHEIPQTVKGAIYILFGNAFIKDLYELLHNKLILGVLSVATIVLGVYAIYDWRNHKKAMKKIYSN